MSMTRIFSALAVAAALVFIGTSSLYTLTETQAALVVRMGKPVAAVTLPGLHGKAPLIDSVVLYDANLLALQSPAEQVIMGDQKRIEVETYTRYRIADALLFYQTLRLRDQAALQLSQMVSSSLRRELGQVNLLDLLSAKRTEIVGVINAEVKVKARPLGIEIIDVRIRRADLPTETSQAIYDRMKSEREREAKELRAQGFEWASQIRAKAERERTVLLSEANGHARTTRGEADAQSGRALAQAAAKNPGLFVFERSLRTYRQALAESWPTLILSGDAPFLRYLKQRPDSAVIDAEAGELPRLAGASP